MSPRLRPAAAAIPSIAGNSPENSLNRDVAPVGPLLEVDGAERTCAPPLSMQALHVMVVGGGPDVLPRVEPLLPAGGYDVEFVGLDQEPYGCITDDPPDLAGRLPAHRRRRRVPVPEHAADGSGDAPPAGADLHDRSPKDSCCRAWTTSRPAVSHRGAPPTGSRGTDAIVERHRNERRSPPCARAPRLAGPRAGRGEDLSFDGDPPAERGRRAHRDRRAAAARLPARLPPRASASARWW